MSVAASVRLRDLRACTACILALLVGGCGTPVPVATIDQFELDGIGVFDNADAPYAPSVMLTIRAKPGCPLLDENAPVALNGVRGRVENILPGGVYPTCTPYIHFEYQRPADGAEDGIVDFGDGRFLVMQNLVASRGWTRDGVLVDEIADGAGGLVVLTWSPASDRLDADAVFYEWNSNGGWSGTFPIEANTVSLLVPQADDPTLSMTSNSLQGFDPPITRCEGFSNCPELVAAGVRGLWSRVLTVLPPSP